MTEAKTTGVCTVADLLRVLGAAPPGTPLTFKGQPITRIEALADVENLPGGVFTYALDLTFEIAPPVNALDDLP